MLEPKNIANFDQSAQFLVHNFPPLLWNLFKKSQEAGFTDKQAMEIVLTYIKAC